MKLTRKDKLRRRHLRIRRKVAGTTEAPRVCIRKSLKHLYVQVIDDSPETGSKTIASYGTARKDTASKHMCNVENAAKLGKQVGEDLKTKGFERVVFDRGGNRYHGVVRTLAESIREAGLKI